MKKKRRLPHRISVLLEEHASLYHALAIEGEHCGLYTKELEKQIREKRAQLGAALLVWAWSTKEPSLPNALGGSSPDTRKV